MVELTDIAWLASTIASLSMLAKAVLWYRPTMTATLIASSLVASSFSVSPESPSLFSEASGSSGDCAAMTLSATVCTLSDSSASTFTFFFDFNAPVLPTLAMTSLSTWEYDMAPDKVMGQSHLISGAFFLNAPRLPFMIQGIRGPISPLSKASLTRGSPLCPATPLESSLLSNSATIPIPGTKSRLLSMPPAVIVPLTVAWMSVSENPRLTAMPARPLS